MFDFKEVKKHYGASVFYMPYLWICVPLIIDLINSLFIFDGDPNIETIKLIVTILSVGISLLYSHKVLLWATNVEQDNVFLSTLSSIIQKMTYTPIALVNYIIDPENYDDESDTSTVIIFLLKIVTIAIMIFFGRILFFLLALLIIFTNINTKPKKISTSNINTQEEEKEEVETDISELDKEADEELKTEQKRRRRRSK
ncbi:MAG: hypothetical protein ACK5HS_02520 [Mycoplasmatales bacterium]